jgi:hypothetical protein
MHLDRLIVKKLFGGSPVFLKDRREPSLDRRPPAHALQASFHFDQFGDHLYRKFVSITDGA